MSCRSGARAAPVAAAFAATLFLLLTVQSVAGLGNETKELPAPVSGGEAAAPFAVPAALAVPAEPAARIAPTLLGYARRANKGRSTSSSSGEKKKDSGSSSKEDNKKQSLEMDSMSDLSDDNKSGAKGKKKKGAGKYIPKSSAERRGWRKWHRKCTPCPEQSMKWRDPRILWICGGYQRARRSFKSACMMRYRNCQDGTMFVKLYNHRCKPDPPGEPRPHGEDFFYTYHVRISGDSSEKDDKSSSGALASAESDSSAVRRRAMDWRPEFGVNRTVGTSSVTQNKI